MGQQNSLDPYKKLHLRSTLSMYRTWIACPTSCSDGPTSACGCWLSLLLPSVPSDPYIPLASSTDVVPNPAPLPAVLLLPLLLLLVMVVIPRCRLCTCGGCESCVRAVSASAWGQLAFRVQDRWRMSPNG